jgi:hypothetical protein
MAMGVSIDNFAIQMKNGCFYVEISVNTISLCDVDRQSAHIVSNQIVRIIVKGGGKGLSILSTWE